MTDAYIPINHCYYTMRYMAVLLPKSIMINRNINRAEEGAVIFMTYDETYYRLIKKIILPVFAEITEILSFQLYNKPMKDVFRLWVGNYGKEVSKKECYYLVLDKIEYDIPTNTQV